MGKAERRASKQEKNICYSYLRKELSSQMHEFRKQKRKGSQGQQERGEVVPVDAPSRMLAGATGFPPGHRRGRVDAASDPSWEGVWPSPMTSRPQFVLPARPLSYPTMKPLSCNSNPALALASFVPSGIIQLMPWPHKKHPRPSYWTLPRARWPVPPLPPAP